MLGDITKPMSYHLPPEKICEKLKKKDSQICELQYGKKESYCTLYMSLHTVSCWLLEGNCIPVGTMSLKHLMILDELL